MRVKGGDYVVELRKLTKKIRPVAKEEFPKTTDPTQDRGASGWSILPNTFFHKLPQAIFLWLSQIVDRSRSVFKNRTYASTIGFDRVESKRERHTRCDLRRTCIRSAN